MTTTERIIKPQKELIRSNAYHKDFGFYDRTYSETVNHYYCGKCGKEVSGASKLCSYCGAQFTN